MHRTDKAGTGPRGIKCDPGAVCAGVSAGGAWDGGVAVRYRLPYTGSGALQTRAKGGFNKKETK